jgi:hypothetical protein
MQVVYQPEAARRERASLVHAGSHASRKDRPALKLVHSSDPPATIHVSLGSRTPDDPGPSAA